MNRENHKILKDRIYQEFLTLNLKDIEKEFSKKPLLTSNLKLEKGDLKVYGLELLGADLYPEKNLCNPSACVDCKLHCLVFAGIGNILKKKKYLQELTAPIKCKLRKTFLYFNDREFFIKKLESEIIKHGKKCYYRLNTTSDLNWLSFIKKLPDYNFYDYTKYWKRKSLNNYHLTFSVYQGISDTQQKNKLKNGENIAKIFYNVLPEKEFSFPVINGDIDDFRFKDKKGVIVGLKLKNTL
ncbi:unnamed protein product [marine sediment metagenome]|uniref:Gene product 88 domain-containing protein n=1 Tax=marine sediment metagenome TaxID=412755 RepID=X0RX26_9ZZZZ